MRGLGSIRYGHAHFMSPPSNNCKNNRFDKQALQEIRFCNFHMNKHTVHGNATFFKSLVLNFITRSILLSLGAVPEMKTWHSFTSHIGKRRYLVMAAKHTYLCEGWWSVGVWGKRRERRCERWSAAVAQ